MLRTNQNGKLSERGGRRRAGRRGELVFPQPRHSREDTNRISDPSPGYGRSIGDQTKGRRLKQVEPQTDQKRSGNRHRRAAAARTFHKCTETKAEQYGL